MMKFIFHKYFRMSQGFLSQIENDIQKRNPTFREAIASKGKTFLCVVLLIGKSTEK